jgi:hypothetical protein
MSVGAAKFLRRFLATTAIVIGLFGATSYFLSWALAYRWTPPDSTGPVVWAGCDSGGGALEFYYERLPRILNDARMNRSNNRIPGLHISHIGRKWIVWLSGASQRRNTWWIRTTNVTFREMLPGTVRVTPTTAPVIYPVRIQAIDIPYWLLLLVTGAYPLYRLLDLPSQRRRKRFAAGECLACGYDLRHTPDRCPECGLIPATAPPPDGPLSRLVFLKAIGKELWLRICLYPVFFALFSLAFSWAYFWYYQK